MCEERDRPHDVHGGSREDDGRAPDTVDLLAFVSDVVYAANIVNVMRLIGDMLLISIVESRTSDKER